MFDAVFSVLACAPHATGKTVSPMARMSGSVLGTLWVVALFATPVVARASEDGAESTASTEATASTDAADSPDDVPTKALTATDGADDAAAGDAAVGTVQGEVEGAASTIRRGFFVQGDVGLFTTLGGVRMSRRTRVARCRMSSRRSRLSLATTWPIAQSMRSRSGCDLRWLSTAVRAHYGGGGNRRDDRRPGTAVTKSADYSVMEAGLQLGLSWMVAERFALLFKSRRWRGDRRSESDARGHGTGCWRCLLYRCLGLRPALSTSRSSPISRWVSRFGFGVLVPEAGGGSVYPGPALTAPVKYTFSRYPPWAGLSVSKNSGRKIGLVSRSQSARPVPRTSLRFVRLHRARPRSFLCRS